MHVGELSELGRYISFQNHIGSGVCCNIILFKVLITKRGIIRSKIKGSGEGAERVILTRG